MPKRKAKPLTTKRLNLIRAYTRDKVRPGDARQMEAYRWGLIELCWEVDRLRGLLGLDVNP